MRLLRWLLYQFRRLLGMNHLDTRFNAVEDRLKRIEEQGGRGVAADEAVPQKGGGERAGDPEFTQAIERVIHQINDTNHNLYLHLREAMRVRDLHFRDLMMVLDSVAHRFPAKGGAIRTDHPIAYDTDDHKIPWGTAQDNTRSPRFVAACERHFDGRAPLTFLDLGCSGGGLVLDFILRGHEAYGVEGSDYSLRAQRAEWRLLPNNLFTADITKPFTVVGEGGEAPVQCDVITAWEVMEHIATGDLPQLLTNVRAHLKPDGIFVGSIALGPDDHGGASYHRTVQPRLWWEKTYLAHGLEMIDSHGFQFYDFCRGTGNGPIDGNYLDDPTLGFHFVAIRKDKPANYRIGIPS